MGAKAGPALLASDKKKSTGWASRASILKKEGSKKKKKEKVRERKKKERKKKDQRRSKKIKEEKIKERIQSNDQATWPRQKKKERKKTTTVKKNKKKSQKTCLMSKKKDHSLNQLFPKRELTGFQEIRSCREGGEEVFCEEEDEKMLLADGLMGSWGVGPRGVIFSAIQSRD